MCIRARDESSAACVAMYSVCGNSPAADKALPHMLSRDVHLRPFETVQAGVKTTRLADQGCLRTSVSGRACLINVKCLAGPSARIEHDGQLAGSLGADATETRRTRWPHGVEGDIFCPRQSH